MATEQELIDLTVQALSGTDIDEAHTRRVLEETLRTHRQQIVGECLSALAQIPDAERLHVYTCVSRRMVIRMLTQLAQTNGE